MKEHVTTWLLKLNLADRIRIIIYYFIFMLSIRIRIKFTHELTQVDEQQWLHPIHCKPHSVTLILG